MFSTKSNKNYYNIFKFLLYKYSKASWKDVLVLNVDVNSTDKGFNHGKEICDQLGIHFINNRNERAKSYQESIKIVDTYLTKNNINVDWIIHFQHDVIPLEKNFWDQIDNIIEKNNFLNKYVGTFGPVSYVKYNYNTALKKIKNKKNIDGTISGRGNLINGILNPPYKGWYQNLHTEYYNQNYFVVESPMWNMIAINRSLFKKYIIIDSMFEFELWADDIAHQFLKNNIFNLTFPNLRVCTDHSLKNNQINTDCNFIRNKLAAKRFLQKYKWSWGYRNKNLRNEFKKSISLYNNTLQKKLFYLNINDGPKKIEDFL